MFFQLIDNQFFAGKNKSEDFINATNTLCGSPLHGKFACFIVLEYYLLFCFRTFCLSKCFYNWLAINFLQEKINPRTLAVQRTRCAAHLCPVSLCALLLWNIISCFVFAPFVCLNVLQLICLSSNFFVQRKINPRSLVVQRTRCAARLLRNLNLFRSKTDGLSKAGWSLRGRTRRQVNISIYDTLMRGRYLHSCGMRSALVCVVVLSSRVNCMHVTGIHH